LILDFFPTLHSISQVGIDAYISWNCPFVQLLHSVEADMFQDWFNICRETAIGKAA